MSGEKYGVPTGVVPRRDHYAESLDRGKRVGALIDSIRASAKTGDPIQQAVDDYLLMERKARALDDIRRQLLGCDMRVWVDEIDRLVHPAHKPSTS